MKKIIPKIIIFIIALLLTFCKSNKNESFGYPFLNPELSIDERVKDLVDRLTLEEKVTQMAYNAPAIDRLGIPAYNWWNESLHGVARSGVATVFPQAIGLGATFDEELLYRVASAISDEARAMYNASVAKGYRLQYGGLTFWSPNINIFRDPRWGRGQETYGEDPFLTSKLGVAYVKGLQGDNPKYMKAAACAKHFAVHSGPEKLRHEFNALSTRKDLYETYLPAFKALVDAGVESVMCAYNRTNNEPCCASNYLLTETLRSHWGFKGHIVSDCGALADFHEGHKVSANEVEAAALALKSGVNLNCGGVYKNGLMEAIKNGMVSEEILNQNVSTLLKTRFKLGLFDPPGLNPYDDISTKVINSDENRNLAYEAAVKSMVLLKNNGVLPLSNDLAKYFVTGPNATSVEVLLGNYYGINSNMVTILEGLASKIKPGSQLQYRLGCLLDRENLNPIDWTTGSARSSDATIVVMGISGLLEGEEGESIASPYFGDRLEYDIPQNQISFLKKLRKNNPKPIIAVITGGSPMNLAEVHELADAVLLAWYPGEEGGNAVADIIFGNVSPSGRLPVTFPKSLDQLPPYEDYRMEGRTYKYMEKEPLYPFGFGLSFSKFEYSGLSTSANTIAYGGKIILETTIINSGPFNSDEVVQLYISALYSSVKSPFYSLKGIQRITLKAGETKVIQFEITSEMLNLINEEGISVLEKGKYKILVGGSLPGKRSEELGAGKCLETIVEVI